MFSNFQDCQTCDDKFEDVADCVLANFSCIFTGSCPGPDCNDTTISPDCKGCICENEVYAWFIARFWPLIDFGFNCNTTITKFWKLDGLTKKIHANFLLSISVSSIDALVVKLSKLFTWTMAGCIEDTLFFLVGFWTKNFWYYFSKS